MLAGQPRRKVHVKTITAILRLTDGSGMSKKAISEVMGKSGNYLASVIEQSRRKGGGVRSSTLSAVAEACGYAVVLLPKDSIPPEAITIDPPE